MLLAHSVLLMCVPEIQYKKMLIRELGKFHPGINFHEMSYEEVCSILDDNLGRDA